MKKPIKAMQSIKPLGSFNIGNSLDKMLGKNMTKNIIPRSGGKIQKENIDLRNPDRTPPTNTGFIRESKKVVLQSLKDLGGWRQSKEVREYGKTNLRPPITAYKYTEYDKKHMISPQTMGGHSVFDYTDRTTRYLENLHKTGLVEKQQIPNKKSNLYKIKE